MAQTDNAAANAGASQQSAHDSSAEAYPGFSEFFRSSFRPVVKAVMLAGATHEEAEDAASKAFLEMLSKWPVQGKPLSYACRAAINNFTKERIRGSLRLVNRIIERGPASVREEGAEDDRLCELEDLETVEGILSELTPAQREVMERVARGLNYDEIATELGKSTEVVRRRLCDARARLTQITAPGGTKLEGPSPAAELPPQEDT